jgi:hypothetical protein
MTPTPPSLLPPAEAERLHTLRSYDILHSLREPLFDEVVGLTAQIFNLPISLIALVDADEVQYKASHGLPGLHQQPRSEALCALAVKQNKTVVFTDLSQTRQSYITAAADESLRAKGLRFYAGAPIRMPNQRCIGTLCVIDRQPRTFSITEQQVLGQLAHVVGRLIAVRHQCLASPGKGPERWVAVRAELTEEVRVLVALVRYLIKRSGAHVPVEPLVLASVARRLDDLRWAVEEHHISLT